MYSMCINMGRRELSVPIRLVGTGRHATLLQCHALRADPIRLTSASQRRKIVRGHLESFTGDAIQCQHLVCVPDMLPSPPPPRSSSVAAACLAIAVAACLAPGAVPSLRSASDPILAACQTPLSPQSDPTLPLALRRPRRAYAVMPSVFLFPRRWVARQS